MQVSECTVYKWYVVKHPNQPVLSAEQHEQAVHIATDSSPQRTSQIQIAQLEAPYC